MGRSGATPVHGLLDFGSYSRAVARPCFRASIRLSKVDLVQLASRGDGLAARRSSAASVAVAVEESVAESEEAAAAARACGRSQWLPREAGCSAGDSPLPLIAAPVGTVPIAPPGVNGPLSRPGTSSDACSTRN